MQKRRLLLFVAGLIAMLFSATTLYAQPSRQGLPASMQLQMPEVHTPVFVSSGNLDWTMIEAEDNLALSMNQPARAGFSLPVSKSMELDGEWTQLPDGRMMWRLKLVTQSAVSVGVVFDQFHLPDGAELYLYNEDKTFVIGAFTSDNNNAANVFSTHLIPGSTIIIEYIETPANGFMGGSLKPVMINGQETSSRPRDNNSVRYNPQGVLRISELIYAYNDDINEATKELGDAGTCQVNINCSPEGDNWQDEKRGVARILFREGTSWYYCSGTLVNNTLQNGTPYFLTAYHCGAVASAADHLVWQFYFNYERSGCTNTGTPPNNMITGCTKRAEGNISGGTDMQLVELSSTPISTWNVYYNGWDRSGSTTTGGVSIHHPSGDAKKISTFTGTTSSSTWYDGTNTGATNGHWTFPLWASTTNGQGVSEGGSSGSSLFNSAGRVIGTLSGGSSECGGPYSGDLYGKFSIHWQNAVNGSGNAYELKHWLDPAGTNPTTLDAMDPNAIASPPVANFSATPLTVVAGQPVQFSDLSSNLPQSWSWSFTGGFPATSTLRNPTCTWATPGTYTVSLTVSNGYGSDTETKTAYITVTAYTTPTSPVTIGTGTSTANFPYGITNTTPYNRSASIYLNSEVGTNAGYISQVSYYANSARTDTRNIQIYMKHTSETAFSTAVTDSAIASDATLVYSGTFVPSTAGWNTHTLTNPFHYNGTSNLMVIVFVNGTAANVGSANRYSTSTSRHQQWSGTTDPTAVGTINSSRPNIRLAINGYTAPVANFGGMAPILVEDFENASFPPTGWTITNSDGAGKTWAATTSYNYTSGGDSAAAHLYGASGYAETGYLITNQITLPAGGEYYLTFWSNNPDAAYYGDNAVLVSTTTNAVASFTTELWSPTSVTESWSQTTVNLSAYAGQSIYLAFKYTGTYAHSWILDDVAINSINYTQVETYEGDPLVIYDKSTNYPTLWNWSNTGAIPTTQNTQDDYVTYNVAGYYPVTLQAANAAGSNTKTVNNFVHVIGRAPAASFFGAGNLQDIYYSPFIPVGGSVNFTDYSTRVPTGWQWSFPGGIPSSHTGQTPPAISYASAGLYSPSLIATNSHGADTLVGTDFVVVGGTDTCTNMQYWDDITIYSYTNGYLPGHAADASGKIFRYAEFYDNAYPGKISGIQFGCYKAQGTGKTVTWYIWDGSTGTPGTVLWDSVMNITSFTESAWNFINIPDSIAVTGDFFIGYLLNYDATHNYTTHQFCTYMTAFRDVSVASTGWFSYGTTTPGTWSSFEDGFGNAASILLNPRFTYDFEGTVVAASATPGCSTGSVILTASVSANQTFYLTTGTGTAVANWTGNTNTHTFTGLTSGDYKGYVVEGTNTSATSNTVTLTNSTAVPVSVSIASSATGAICPGTSVTFTATPTNGGATPTYQWYEGGSAVGTGTNTYTTTGLTTGEAVYVVLTSSETCVTGNPATSNTINTTVNTNMPVSVNIAASPSGAICSGTSVTFTAAPVNGGTTPAYQWYEGGSAVGTGTATYTTTGLTTGEAVYCVLTSNVTCPTGNPATSNTITTTVNPNLPVSVTISANPGTTVCSGTSVTFTATPVNGGTTPVYQWKVNGVNVGSNSSTYTSSTLTTGNTVTCQVTSNATCPTGSPATSNTLTMTVNPNLPVSVSIAANPGTTICSGTSVTFTATPTNGGTTPVYQWKLNGTNVGSNSTTYTNAALVSGDVVTCQLTSNATCATGSPATSNTLTMTVNPNLPVSVSIAANPGTTICTGTSVTFTATPSNGGTTPVYQWKLNGTNVGSNSTTYTNAALVSGDVVTCQLTSNATCATGSPATSNALTMTVNSSLPVSVTIAANPGSTICVGTNVTFTAIPTNGGTTPAYQWKVNGTNVGTGATYASTTLTTGQVVSCVLTSNEGCATGNPATSNTITMTVTANVTPSVSIAASATTICSGTNVTFTATPANGGATPVYQWKLNGANVGSNSTTYTNAALVSGDIVTCSMTSALTCTVENPVTSNSITMTVNPNLPVSASIAANPGVSICSGTSVTFTATATNGGTTPVYQWKLNGTNVGSNSTTYTNTSLSNSDAVTCVLTSNVTCSTGSPATSNALTMVVSSSLPVSVSIAANPGSTICAGTSVTFTATPTNGGATPTYTWKVNGVTQGTNSPTFTTSSLTNGQIVTCVLASSESCATGSPATSNAITMTVNANSAVSVSVAASATTICAGTSVTFTATPTNGGTPTYQWYLNGTAVGSNSATYTNASLANGNTVNCVMTSSLTCATGNPATSNTVTMTVNPTNPVSVSITANPGTTICTGTSVTFTATPTNGGTTPVYQWKLNGTNVGSNSTTYTNAALASGDVVTCQLTSDATCATGNPATSNALSMTVNFSLPVSVSIAANPGSTICAGTSVTFTATPTNGGTTPVYQWYLNSNPVGSNSASYTNASLVNGDEVNVVMISNASCGTGSPATSNNISLTVNVVPSITSQPVASTIGDGGNTSFSVTATGAGLTYQWQISTDGGTTYNNILAAGTNPVYSGWTTSTLGLTGVVTANNGYLYRCIVSGTCAPSVTSNGALLSVNNAPAITSHPAGSTVCAGLNTSFSVTATGTITGYQWQVSTDGGTTFNNILTAGANPAYSGYSTQTLALTGVVASNDGYQYRCVVSGPVPPNATSNAATLTVQEAPVVTVNPAPASICNGANTSFAVTATGDITTYQWQVSTDGGTTYNNILAAGTNPVYAGWSTTTLSLTGAVSANNGYKYRCVVSGFCAPAATSTGALLTVSNSMPVSVAIAASPAGAICNGTSVTYTATPTNGGTTPVYQWYLNGTAVGSNSNTYTNATHSNGDAVSCVLTSNVACATGNPATSNVINVSVSLALPVSASIAASPAGIICAGTSVTFTATPVNGGTTPVYQWYVNGSAVGSNSPTYTSNTLLDNQTVVCVVTSNSTCATGNPATSNTVVMDVAPLQPVSVSIAASPAGTICEGTPVTFTATAVNGGTTPVYAWFVNGVSVGSNSATFASSTLNNGDAVTCALTSNIGCATGSPATSNTVTMSVTNNLPVSVSIAASATTICNGTSVTFTATPVNGGTSPDYAWFVNGTAVGFNSSTYTSNGLVNGDVVTCNMTSDIVCVSGNPAASNAINMTVNPGLPASVTIAAAPAGTICAGTSVTFTATPVNGGTTPVYTWYVGASVVGSNSPTFTSNTLLDNQIVTVVMNSTALCATGSPAVSNAVAMDVNPLMPASVTIAASPAGAVCANTPVTFTATAVNGGTTPAYAWFINGVSVGSNSSIYTSSSLNTGDAITCVLTSNATCVSGNPATSNVINMTINPDQPVSITIAGVPPGAICAGTSVTFVATPVNGGNNPVYAWFVNGTSVGSNNLTYTTSTLANNDVVTCVLNSNATCATGSPATSNAITMAVNPVLTPSVSIVASATDVCAGSPVTFTATGTDAGTAPVYAWYVNGVLSGPNTATYINSSLNSGDVVTCTVLSNATCSVGATATSNAITMTVNTVLTAGVGIAASPASSICDGTTVNFTATPINGGTTPVYTWYANGIPVGTGAAYSSNTLADGNVITCVMTSDATCVVGNPATSNAVTMSVGTVLPVSVSVAASPIGSVCSGEPVTFTANVLNGGSNPVYTWFVNGSAAGSNIATFTSTSLVNGDAVTCTVTSDLACASGNPATSAPVVMNVNTSYPVSINVVVAPAGAVCSGEPVTFTATALNAGTVPVYQWYVNGIASGSNSDTYISSSLVNGDVVTCEVTSDLVCAMNNPAASAPITMTVNTTLPVSVSIDVTPATSVCEGTTMTFTATGVNGGTNPVYEWTVNGSVVGTNSNTFASSTLINGDVVSCTFTSNEICTSNNPAVSNNIAVVIASYTVGGAMSSMETEVCEGSSTGTIILSGYVGDILYWQRRIDGGIWTNIPGTAGFGTYSEITTASGVWEYRAVVQSGTCNVDTSSLIGINVLATPVASFTMNLMDPTVEFINTSLNATSYNWTFGDGNSSTEVNPTHTYASDNSYTVTLTAHNGICQNVYTTTVDIIASAVIELEGLNIAMFPNPSNGEFDITLSGNNNGTLQMEIHDVTGRLIRNEILSSMGSGSVFHVSLGEVNAGLYSVRFIYNDNSITRMMVVE